MNDDTATGIGQDVGGKVKETAGDVTGNAKLQNEGVADQLGGKASKAIGSAKDALGNAGPLVDRAKGFAKQRPFAAAALAGVIGVALLNTLRGKK